MLVLSRKAGEKIVIGNNITITLVRCEGGRVRIGVSAPDEVRVLRGELVSPTFFALGCADEHRNAD